MSTSSHLATAYPRPRAVLFDLYDTLAYLTPAVIQEGRRELARLAGVDPEVWAPVWRSTAMERMLGSLGGMEDQIRHMLGGLGVDPSPELVTRLAKLEEASWVRGVRLYPEAEPLLRELRRRGHKLGLVSNCSCQAGQVIHHLGLPELMDTLVLSCEVGLAKPDPAIFLHASQALGVEPDQCMFVADGAFGELDAARALGMLAVKVEQPHQSGDYGMSERFDHRVESLTEVLGLVGGGRRAVGSGQ